MTVVLVHRLSRVLFDERTAIIAALLAATEPLMFWASGTMLTESLHAQVLALVALAVAWALDGHWGGFVRWGAVGPVIAIATHVRPSTYFLPALMLPIVLYLAHRRRVPWRRSLVSAVAVVVPVVVLVGGWQLRNADAVDSLRFSGIEAQSMYFYRAAGVLAETSGADFVEVRDQLQEECEGLAAGAPQGPYYDRMYGRGLGIVMDEPGALVRITIKGLVSETLGASSTVFPYLGVDERPWILGLARSSVALFWCIAAIGFASAIRRPLASRAPAVFCGVLVMYVLVISAGPESYSRFRTPVMPILCSFAAAGLVVIADRWRHRPTREGQLS